MAHTVPVQETPDAGSLASVLNGGLLHRLAPYHVVLHDRAQVELYLANHSELSPLLESICSRLRDSFGQQAELSLEYYKDPEQEDQYPVLYVRQPSYEAGILKQIESVISPFMPQLEDATGHLLVTTDFRRPRGWDVI